MKNLYKYLFSMLVIFGVVASPLSTFASSTEEVTRIKNTTIKKFVVSAYYSPLPNQQAYVRGTYEGDLRLNGNGTHGADGTAVYVGMLAAPKTYAFGTKIQIPGLGVGTVHDRGGAIIPYKDFDRIDVWMGYGDAGRRRALQWGMRSVTGKILPRGTANKMNFGVMPKASQYQIAKAHYTPQASGKGSLWKGAKGESVKNLQKFLREEGFFDGLATGYYGERTEVAVLKFQKYYGVIDSKNSPGAGVFGPMTRKKFEEVWTQNDALKEYAVDVAIIPSDLKVGAKGYEVKRLQITLKSLGYFNDVPNGVYGPKTKKAITDFQLQHRIISSRGDRYAGYFGVQTKKNIEKQLLIRRKNIKKSLRQDEDSITQQQLAMRQKKINLQQYAVNYGERSDTVKNLQTELIKRGFLENELNTGFYGQKTQQALEKYKKFVG